MHYVPLPWMEVEAELMVEPNEWLHHGRHALLAVITKKISHLSLDEYRVGDNIKVTDYFN